MTTKKLPAAFKPRFRRTPLFDPAVIWLVEFKPERALIAYFETLNM